MADTAAITHEASSGETRRRIEKNFFMTEVTPGSHRLLTGTSRSLAGSRFIQFRHGICVAPTFWKVAVHELHSTIHNSTERVFGVTGAGVEIDN